MMSPKSARSPMPWILAVSAAVTAFLIWWIYLKTPGAAEAPWIEALPALNATFNTLAALCLTAGFFAIRRKEKTVHLRFMIAALVFSGLFLGSYLTYHHFHGDTPFPGEGWVRPAYFAILISHIVLSVVMLPMILATLNFAARGQFASHKKIARFTLPIWLYVSVTGVVVFFFLKVYTGS